ncbi:alpha/beta hydrolase fold family protein [Paecilomyces variotii No. 5]|uniref:Alpha/beta hydrolase fold family protein n=1 Tax=Byssochlamys spectabilis (strain No. 5 / NBRC 109023) TaxID=1356009 RepID=V5GA97_BYSSN|nr:alpha/beta hydrolase fold family protein [Paecilomyces variotii No. 5]
MGVQILRVPHLGGIDVAYQMPHVYDRKKPTLLLIHSFMATSDQYIPQFSNKDLTDAVNLIAVDLLGHGQTRTKSENYTYWDSAYMLIQLLDALTISKFYALGTSQGGWIAARLALLAPTRVQGIFPLGTSMDSESDRSRNLGCWDLRPIGEPIIRQLTAEAPAPDFGLTEEFCNLLIDLGFGKDVDIAIRQALIKGVQENYRHEDGRKRARMSMINLSDRDGLHGRLADVICPVLWLHGTSDPVYSIANAEDTINLFTNSPRAIVQVIQGGQHFLSASHPAEVDAAVLSFIKETQFERPEAPRDLPIDTPLKRLMLNARS